MLEPVMTVEVSVPDGPCVGEVISDLSSHKRARIREVGTAASLAETITTGAQARSAPGTGSHQHHASSKVLIRCDVPLREMVGYSTAIRSRTAGEGGFSMEFSRYAPVGPQLQRSLLDNPLEL